MSEAKYWTSDGECRECHNNRRRDKNNSVNTNSTTTKVYTKCDKEYPATEEYFTKFKGGNYESRQNVSME